MKNAKGQMIKNGIAKGIFEKFKCFQNPLVKTFGSNSEFGVPTSVDWVHENSSRMVAAYKKNATCIIYEIESGKPVMKLDITPVSIDKQNNL